MQQLEQALDQNRATDDSSVDATAAENPKSSKIKANNMPAVLFAKIVWLLQQSSSHKFLFLSDLEWFLMPAVSLKQFRVLQKGTIPVALVLWALISEKVEKELMAGRTRLRPDEWNSGNRLWIIELVAPSAIGGKNVIQTLLAEISKTVFRGKPAKMRVVLPDGRGTRFVDIRANASKEHE